MPAVLQPKQPSLYRIWNTRKTSFSYTDDFPGTDILLCDRWTSFWDKEQRPLYENDLVVLHYTFKSGWIVGVVTRHQNSFGIRPLTIRSRVLEIYWLQESYKEGNVYQTKLDKVEAECTKLNKGFTDELDIYSPGPLRRF